jgi:hypothetical protein
MIGSGVQRRAVVALAVVLVAVATGCGADADPNTPEGTLEALADAVSASDDAAVSALTCAEARNKGTSIAEAKALAVEADPKLADFGYEAEAGSIVEETSTTAVGTLIITVKGIPDDLSDTGHQFLDSAGAPRPLSLQHAGGRINLIKSDGRWYACT